MNKEMLDIMQNAIDKAKEKLSQASYLSECGSNQGLRQMNSNKVEWLRWVVYLAELGFEALEKEEELKDNTFNCETCPVTAEAVKLLEQKDKTIKELCDKLTEVTERLKSLQTTYDCEVEYRKALAQKAKIDHFTEVLKVIHDRCWLDGTVLVTPVDYLDRCLLEMIKE
jgi:hypothetical protein